MSVKTFRITGIDAINPCPNCQKHSAYAGTNVDGLWFVKCPDCGLSTENHTNYEDAQLAWAAGHNSEKHFVAVSCLIVMAVALILVILNIIL